MSLIRPQDYLHVGTALNIYWAELLRTVDEFDQLMQLEKRQIAACIKQFNLKRTELVRQFSQFKDSMRFEGEVPKRQVVFVQMAQFSSLFKGYHHFIVDLIQKIILEPKVLAQLLGNFVDIKRLKFQDFLENIVFNIYPYYLPASNKAPLFVFIRQVMAKWPYNPELIRPTNYTLIDQTLEGLMKAPSVVCYVEKIVSYFLQESQKCMSVFAFDQDANELNIKRQTSATFSHYNQKKPTSWKDKFKGFFRKDKDQEILMEKNRYSAHSQFTNEESFLDNNKELQGLNPMEIAKARQQPLFQLIRKLANYILNQQIPIYLCRLLACFDQKLEAICNNKFESRLKHYCYFLMTSLVLSELHNKFTVSHQESGMSHAQLQNISQIIKFLNAIFQGILPQSDKYRVKVSLFFPDFVSKVQAFYSNALSRGRMQISQDDKLLQVLLGHYERSIVLSLNDVYLIIAMIQKSKPTTYLPDPPALIEFMKGKQGYQLFQNGRKTKQIKYKGGSHSMEHIYLIYQSRNPSIKQVIDYYLTVDQPLADIPLIREILLNSSNLKINQALQIQQDLKLVQKLPIKQLRGFLGKLAHKFKQLRVRDGRLLQAKFQQSFKRTLTRSLRRKQWLLYYRSQLSQRLGAESVLMNYFTGQLNSAQFYERMAVAFCQSVKIKIYLNIQNNVFNVHQTPQQLKKIQISTLMGTFLLKQWLKMTQEVTAAIKTIFLEIHLRCFKLKKNFQGITMMALVKGRKADEFNVVFQQISNIIVSKIQQFVTKRHIMQVLSQQKLALIVVKRMQDKILNRFRQQNLPNQKDKQLYLSSLKVNKNQFWKKDLQIYGLDRQFIVAQGEDKFKSMIEQKNVWGRLKHFGQFFKIIFTILGFIMPKNKISAQIVNPLVQYIILQCASLKHHECLYSIQALRWRETPEDSYHLTLYQSSLTYIRQLMPKDYPL